MSRQTLSAGAAQLSQFASPSMLEAQYRAEIREERAKGKREKMDEFFRTHKSSIVQRNDIARCPVVMQGSQDPYYGLTREQFYDAEQYAEDHMASGSVEKLNRDPNGRIVRTKDGHYCSQINPRVLRSLKKPRSVDEETTRRMRDLFKGASS